MGGVALLLLGVVVVAVTLGLERRTDKVSDELSFNYISPCNGMLHDDRPSQ